MFLVFTVPLPAEISFSLRVSVVGCLYMGFPRQLTDRIAVRKIYGMFSDVLRKSLLSNNIIADAGDAYVICHSKTFCFHFIIPRMEILLDKISEF